MHGDYKEILLDDAVERFAEALNSDEGLEGTQAFLPKRKPGWAQ